MKKTMRLSRFTSAALLVLGMLGCDSDDPPEQGSEMTFFVTSAGLGQGANLGGLEGAERS